MKKWIVLFLIVAIAGVLIVLKIAATPKIKADAIYFNANIVTLDVKKSSAGAVAVKDGKFLAVGNLADIKKFAGRSTKLVDLEGKTVVPGLIDAHCHPMEAMMMKKTWVDCRYPETPSVKKALEHIAAWAKKPRRVNGSLLPAFLPAKINLKKNACRRKRSSISPPPTIRSLSQTARIWESQTQQHSRSSVS